MLSYRHLVCLQEIGHGSTRSQCPAIERVTKALRLTPAVSERYPRDPWRGARPLNQATTDCLSVHEVELA